MKQTGIRLFIVVMFMAVSIAAQEEKPVPKNSMRVSIAGCTRDYIFTVAPRNSDETRSSPVPAGTHFRMNGPRKMISEIRARQGSLIEITGLILKGQYLDGGSVGGVVRIGPGSAPTAGSRGSATGSQNFIDVEGWRTIGGDCPVH
jgi:hypothetical protein